MLLEARQEALCGCWLGLLSWAALRSLFDCSTKEDKMKIRLLSLPTLLTGLFAFPTPGVATNRRCHLGELQRSVRRRHLQRF
jgi:hypothetical protein